MFSTLKFLFIIFVFSRLKDFGYGLSQTGYTSCKLGECEKWNMIIVPMLKTENENQYLTALKSLVETVIGDCKWYYNYVNAQFLTKKMELVKVTDPVEFTDLDYRIHDFIYAPEEQNATYEKMLRYALMKLPLQPPEYGRYILIVTNFERSLSGIVIENDEKLVDKITEFGIQLRTIRVEFDGNRATHINPDQQFSINRIRNISSNYVRVSFIETQSLMTTVQPCPQLTSTERLEHYRYSKHYQVQHWVDTNTNASLFGACLIAFAILAVVFAYFCHLRKKNNSEDFSIINA